MLISVVHQMCTYALYIPPFVQVQASIIRIWMVLSACQRHWPWWNRSEKPGDHTSSFIWIPINNISSQRSQELGHDMHMLCMHFHSLPSETVIPVWPVFLSSKPPRRRRPDSKGQGTLCGQCQHGVRAINPVHSHVDGLRVLSADIFSAGLKSLPAPLVCAQVTHQIWMNGYCVHHRLYAYARWLHMCTLKVIHIKLSAGCLSCDHSLPPLVSKA